MYSYHQMTFAERIDCGKAWLDEHAQPGYAFNMFFFSGDRPTFNVCTLHNEHTVLHRAFAHNDEWSRTSSGGFDFTVCRLWDYLGLSRDNLYMLGLDLPQAEMGQYKEFDKLWENVLTKELWRACSSAGHLLAERPVDPSRRKLKLPSRVSLFGRVRAAA